MVVLRDTVSRCSQLHGCVRYDMVCLSWDHSSLSSSVLCMFFSTLFYILYLYIFRGYMVLCAGENNTASSHSQQFARDGDGDSDRWINNIVIILITCVGCHCVLLTLFFTRSHLLSLSLPINTSDSRIKFNLKCLLRD